MTAVNGLSTTVLLNRDLQTENSTTWNNYRSSDSLRNENKEYDSQNRDLSVGQRYGLDPQHSQANGSFYIDNLKGLIHFSSNISGKTVILKYISDSLGTDAVLIMKCKYTS